MNMQGRLLVDGSDAFVEHGIFVEQYGYKALIQMPSFKTLDSTEWPEYDGEEVDLTAPVLDSKTFSISFCITDIKEAEEFFYFLSDGAYHSFYFADLKKTYTLRMTQNGSFSSNIKLGKLTLSFADDFPVVPEAEYMPFGSSGVKQSGYEIDDIALSQFGAYVLEGTDDNLRKAPKVRENLSVSTADQAGLEYDGEEVTFQTKDTTIKLLIHAPDIDSFWQRWESLFAVLLQPETHIFYFDNGLSAEEYDCHYKSTSVSKFDILQSGRVWCEFSVVLTFTSCSPVTQWGLLASEDYDWIITEETDDPAFVKVRPRSGIACLAVPEGLFIVTEDGETKIYVKH